MVSDLKPTSDSTNDFNEIANLEEEINKVIDNCREIVNSNYDLIKKKSSVGKKKAKPISKAINKNASQITLEKVATDMTNILKDLKQHLNVISDKKDSFSDLVPELERSYQIQNTHSINRHTCKQPPKIVNPPLKYNYPKALKINKINNSDLKAKENMIANRSNASSFSANQTNKKRSSAVFKPRAGTKGHDYSKRTEQRKLLPIKHVQLQPIKRPTRADHLNVSRNVYDPLGLAKEEVQKAIKEQKTFTVRGTFNAVRKALLKRGWIEKLHLSYRDRINEELKKFQNYTIQELLDMSRNKEIHEICMKLIKSKLLGSHQVDLYWCYNYESFKECPDKIKLTKINKFRRDVFSYTSKQGLCDASKKTFWYKTTGIAGMNHPRTYSIVKNGDTAEFIKNFNLTAAMSLLKWVVKNSITQECKVISPTGKIPIRIFDFAVNECYKFIKRAKSKENKAAEEIQTTDKPEENQCSEDDYNVDFKYSSDGDDTDFLNKNAAGEMRESMEHEWHAFLESFYKTVHFGNHFKADGTVAEGDMVRKSNYILTNLREFWPWLDMDGLMNIWILKPTNSSQGVGIHICRTLQYVLNIVKANPNRRYIIQKYIERPLLIYNAKFDIRQWFLISNSVPLTIWMYKYCYLRFSSQTYNLRKLHESIHLTNNSVQCRYSKNSRDIALPAYNMWDSIQFRNYLSDIGYPKVYDEIIYPGMKQCIIAAVLIHQDKLDNRKNCFELYGADFLLTEDFKPWILEINSNPALHSSTPVTAKMCPVVLEDVIRVVVDYEKNNRESTGGFELMYQAKSAHPQSMKEGLQVAKTPVKAEYIYTPPMTEISNFVDKRAPAINLTANTQMEAVTCIKELGKGVRKTLENLLELLKREKQKRHELKSKSIATILSTNIIAESRENQTEHVKLASQNRNATHIEPLPECEEDDMVTQNLEKLVTIIHKVESTKFSEEPQDLQIKDIKSNSQIQNLISQKSSTDSGTYQSSRTSKLLDKNMEVICSEDESNLLPTSTDT